MSIKLRAGVVGAGSFGGHHARKYAGLEDVTFVGVFDPDVQRAGALAGGLGGEAFEDLASLLAKVDVVTVASPASVHAEAALAALNAGKSVYVEKPLATRLEDADRLVQAAAKAGVVLACGHQERIVSAAMGLLDLPEAPLFLESVRFQPWGPRNTDVSCVLDLMIHDIDLALTMSHAEPLTVEAEARITHGPFIDEATAEITLADGATLKLCASRIAETRQRRMRIVLPSGEVEVDFVARTFVNTTPFDLNADFADTPTGRDPLGASVSAFLAAVRGEAPRPAVTGEEAARALDLALAVEMAAGY
ncbi:MAG: Gfo/Idh/MocA family oxidoreductase [Caulobacteraceae bacterium]|nr:Gfo/Idh/MocA family oxidoreductase [Caulobacteraceae bacterium]